VQEVVANPQQIVPRLLLHTPAWPNSGVDEHEVALGVAESAVPQEIYMRRRHRPANGLPQIHRG
jgi:hypothetical protein